MTRAPGARPKVCRRPAGAALVAAALGLAHCTPRPAASPEASRAPATPTAAAPSAPAAPARPLAAGAVLERRFDEAAPHTYTLHVAAGEFARVRLEQRGLDVALHLRGPDGAVLAEADHAAGALGVEDAAWVGAGGGVHTLVVRPVGAWSAGRYTLRVAVQRDAGDAEERRARAFAAHAAADASLRTPARDRLEQAARLYERAHGAWLVAGDPARAVLAQRQWGRVLADQDALRPALTALEAALDAARRLGDVREQAHTLNELVPVALRLHVPDAEERAREALDLARRAGDLFAEAVARTNLGELTFTLGDAELALHHYRAALHACRELGARRQEATVLHAQGVAYVLLGREDEGQELFEQALALRRAEGDEGGAGASLLQLGWVRYVAGANEQALEYYAQSIAVAERLGLKAELPGRLDRRGSALLRLGRHDEALASYQAALELLRPVGDRRGVARVLSNVARVHLARGEPDAALRLLDEALRGLRETRDHDSLPYVLLDRAGVLRDKDDRAGALRDAEAALAQLETLRARVKGDVSRATYLDVRHAFFSFYVDLLMGSGPAAGDAARAAFEAAERGRARALLDDLAWAQRAPRQADDGGAEQELQERVAAALQNERGLAGPDVSQRLSDALRELQERRAARRSVLQRRARAWSDARPLDLAAMRRDVLDDGTLLLAYALGEERSFAWLLGRDVFETRILPPRAEIEQQARQVHALMARSADRAVRPHALLAAARLAETLLDPFHGHLGGRRLLVLSDGALHYVPFAALPVHPESSGVAAPRGWPAGRVPLVAEHEIVTAPSASVLAEVRRREASRERPAQLLAVVADPVFEAHDHRLRGHALPADAIDAAPDALARSVRDVGLSGLPRLPYSQVEAERILALAPREQTLDAVGFEARRDLVRGGWLGRYRVVHFATHGLVNARHPQLSGLVLSRRDEQGQPIDGFLRVDDIYQLDLPADLVVLSGCVTALGREARGEGLLGLTHAFLHAGAARVLVSLWSVHDRQTAELMAHLYSAMLERDLAPAAALREAQLRLLRDPSLSAPAYWAPFVLQGDWRGSVTAGGPTNSAAGGLSP